MKMAVQVAIHIESYHKYPDSFILKFNLSIYGGFDFHLTLKSLKNTHSHQEKLLLSTSKNSMRQQITYILLPILT